MNSPLGKRNSSATDSEDAPARCEWVPASKKPKANSTHNEPSTMTMSDEDEAREHGSSATGNFPSGDDFIHDANEPHSDDPVGHEGLAAELEAQFDNEAVAVHVKIPRSERPREIAKTRHYHLDLSHLGDGNMVVEPDLTIVLEYDNEDETVIFQEHYHLHLAKLHSSGFYDILKHDLQVYIDASPQEVVLEKRFYLGLETFLSVIYGQNPKSLTYQVALELLKTADFMLLEWPLPITEFLKTWYSDVDNNYTLCFDIEHFCQFWIMFQMQEPKLSNESLFQALRVNSSVAKFLPREVLENLLEQKVAEQVQGAKAVSISHGLLRLVPREEWKDYKGFILHSFEQNKMHLRSTWFSLDGEQSDSDPDSEEGVVPDSQGLEGPDYTTTGRPPTIDTSVLYMDEVTVFVDGQDIQVNPVFYPKRLLQILSDELNTQFPDFHTGKLILDFLRDGIASQLYKENDDSILNACRLVVDFKIVNRIQDIRQVLWRSTSMKVLCFVTENQCFHDLFKGMVLKILNGDSEGNRVTLPRDVLDADVFQVQVLSILQTWRSPWMYQKVDFIVRHQLSSDLIPALYPREKLSSAFHCVQSGSDVDEDFQYTKALAQLL